MPSNLFGKEMPPLKPSIDGIIYFYIFICISLLVFNLAYIFRTKGRDKRHIRQTLQWEQQLEQALQYGTTPRQQALMLQKLTSVHQLISYQDAISPHLGEHHIQAYLDENHDVFQALAAEYRYRPAPERAFFAHLMAQYHPGRGRSHDQLAELLLDFLDDSTVYCRQNVLLALCALGNSGAVENALRRFQREGWYHNPRLLSDSLMTFWGHRETLAHRLWIQRHEWSEPFQVAVVQFATQLSSEFTQPFLTALNRQDTLSETRFALIRYFQRWPTPEAKPTLLALALHPDTSGPAIAACAALAKYPGNDTVQVLEQALHSPGWNIRRNAAASLVALGITAKDLPQLTQSGDRYAMEILQYMAQHRKAVAV